MNPKPLSKNMLVAIRTRPLSNREIEYSNIKTIDIQNNSIVTVTTPIQYNYSEEGTKYINKDKKLTISKSKEKQYIFDYAFDEQTPQEDIYHFTTENLIESVMEGFNATVFAYGATGSGKTYTMVGDGENPGLMIRTLSDLFKTLNKVKDKEFNVEISYVEVYNEQLKDLLVENNNINIDIRYDNQKGVVLVGASFKKVNCANDAFKLLMLGNRRRTEGKTEFNEYSSRSHAILQVNVESQDSNLVNLNQVSFGKFFLVDLAGSEKISAATKVNPESGSINKSLLALTNCINCLVSNNRGFIPWRDSKLTRILQDSLSGNCRIVMISTISPSLLTVEETLYTLQYASRAKKIKVSVKKNVVFDNKNIKNNKYEFIINELKNEINKVKGELFDKEKGGVPLANVDHPDLNTTLDVDTLGNEISKHFQEEIKVKKDIIEKEREIENLKVEISENEFKMNSNPTINVGIIKQSIDTKKNEVVDKQKMLSNIYVQLSNLVEKRKKLQKKMNEIIEKDKDSPSSRRLISIYKYYISLIENLNSEHRKNLNVSELKRKDLKIKLLTEQLDLRDNYIFNAGLEIANNNGNFTYNNPKFVTAEEIDLNPFKPKIMKVVANLTKPPSAIQSHRKNNNSNINVNDNNRLNFRVKSPMVKISKNRQYEGEIHPILKNNNMNNYLAKFQRKVPLRNNVSFNLVNNGNNAIRNNIFLKSEHSTIKNEKKNQTNNLRINYSDTNQNDNEISSNNTSRLESEIEKKVKNILGRNIIGRYRRSPYLKNLN